MRTEKEIKVRIRELLEEKVTLTQRFNATRVQMINSEINILQWVLNEKIK